MRLQNVERISSRNQSACLVLLGLAAVVASACGSPASQSPLQDTFDAAWQTAQSRSLAPGVIAGVWTSDVDWATAAGEADVDAGRPMAPTDLLRIGSVTKTFVATMVLRLVQEGQLGLDETLDQYRPDFPNADRVTIRQLLSHTSGIYTWDDDPANWDAIYANLDKHWTVEEMVDLAATKPYGFEPGTDYSYSNTNYFLLGLIIEAITHQTVDQVLQEKICEPLGLRSTFFADGPEFPGETVRGYELLDGRLTEVGRTELGRIVNYELAWTAGGIVSSLNDLKIWARAVATGELLSPELHAEQLPTAKPPTDEVPIATGYGLGLALQDGWLGHTGGVAGYTIAVYFHPEHDGTIVTFFNKFDVRDEAMIALDLAAFSVFFVELSRAVFPDTYPDLGDPDDLWPGDAR